MTEGTLARWKKSVGDAVKPGDSLAEIETDKATMDWECQEEGYIAKIVYPNGEKDIPIGKPLLVIVEDRDDIRAIPDTIFQEPSKEQISTPPPANHIQNATSSTIEVPKSTSSSGRSIPTEIPLIQEFNRSFSRPKISPLARKLAAKQQIDLSSLNINGSGPGGRIIESDILSMLDKQKQQRPISTNWDSPQGVILEKPLSSMRRTIAKRLTESITTIPHFHLNCKVKMDSLLGLRKRVNDRLSAEKSESKLSVNDLIIKAVAISLKRHPTVNASWMGGSIKEYSNVDISIAVSTGEGLITPIVFNADKIGLLEVSNEVKRLAGKAKAQTLAPSEFMGGTFTISNLGMYGIESFTSIINLPQAAILSVGTTEIVWKSIQQLDQNGEEIGPVEENKLIPCSEMTLTLGCDHRVIDGVLGAQFLGTLRLLLEDPAQMLL